MQAPRHPLRSPTAELTGKNSPLSSEMLHVSFRRKRGRIFWYRLLKGSEFPALSCRFAGDIAPGQQAAFEELQTYIRKHRLEDHVRFCGNVDDVPSFLHSLDAFALPSLYEGFGIALIEAMACGLPCTASRLDGPAEIITDDSLGLLFTPGDVNALADSIRTLLVRKHAGQWKEAQISASIRLRFSIDSMVSAHLSLYERLLS